MRLVRSLLSFVAPMSSSAAAVYTPGTPPPGVVNSYALIAYQTRLNTIVTPGDIVLLKRGTSRARSNWAAIVRFANRSTMESSAGYATLYQSEATGFGAMTPGPDAIYLRASTSTIYKAGGTTYRITLTK